MKWKRSISSYPLWACLILVGALGLVLSTIDASFAFGANEVVGVVITIVLLTIAGSCTYFLHIYKKFHPEEEEYPGWLYAVMTIVLVVCFACGILLTTATLSGRELSSPYFDVAKVRAGCRAPYFVHGATNTYVAFLNKVFFFFGNKIQVGIYAQIILWVLAVLLIGVGVTFAISKKAAVAVVILGALTPTLRREAMELSPTLLYLVFWSAVFAWICFSQNLKHRRVIVGINFCLIGISTYFDISGLLLAVMYLTLMHHKRQQQEEKESISSLLMKYGIGIAAFVVGFMVCIMMDASFSEKELLPLIGAWFQSYALSFDFSRSLYDGVTSLEYIPAYFLICLGGFAFWRDHSKDVFKGWMTQILIILLGLVSGLLCGRVSGTVFLAVMLYILAGLGLESGLAVVEWEPIIEPTTSEAKIEKMDSENQKKSEEKKKSSNVKKPDFSYAELDEELTREIEKTASEEMNQEPDLQKQDMETPQPEIKFLENPLPLPKKHEKKTLDFPISSKENDDYDYAVADDDDYDLP